MSLESAHSASELPAAELAELNDLLWSLPSTLDPYAILAVLLEKGARLFQAPLSAVYLKEGAAYELAAVYGFTDKTYNLYEDDIPKAMIEQVGERVTFVNELIIYGALRACTNAYYGGTGTTIATVNGAISLGLLRKIAKNLQANHGKPVNKMLKASQNFDTSAVSEGYTVYCHTDLEPDIRDLPNFTPVEKYATGTPMPNEIGKCERFRFLTSPDLPALQRTWAAMPPGFTSPARTAPSSAASASRNSGRRAGRRTRPSSTRWNT